MMQIFLSTRRLWYKILMCASQIMFLGEIIAEGVSKHTMLDVAMNLSIMIVDKTYSVYCTVLSNGCGMRLLFHDIQTLGCVLRLSHDN